MSCVCRACVVRVSCVCRAGVVRVSCGCRAGVVQVTFLRYYRMVRYLFANCILYMFIPMILTELLCSSKYYLEYFSQRAEYMMYKVFHLTLS